MLFFQHFKAMKSSTIPGSAGVRCERNPQTHFLRTVSPAAPQNLCGDRGSNFIFCRLIAHWVVGSS